MVTDQVCGRKTVLCVLKVCELLALDTVCWKFVNSWHWTQCVGSPHPLSPFSALATSLRKFFIKIFLICHKDILGYPAEILTVDTFSEEASVCFGLAWPVGKVLLGRNCVRSTWEKQETELKSLDKFMGEKLQKKGGWGRLIIWLFSFWALPVY